MTINVTDEPKTPEYRELRRLPRSGPEKVALAWWLRRRTTVPLHWVSERLAMGHYTRVTQAVSRMERSPGSRLRPLSTKLLALEKEIER